jgi:hypothetical protein
VKESRGQVVFEGEVRTAWNDMAGKPADEYEPDIDSLLKLLRDRKDRAEAIKAGIIKT